MLLNIPENLITSAYVSKNGEPAWPSKEALEVIDWATSSSLAVFGVEVWLPTMPGPTIPTPYIYTLETERHEGESWDDFVVRANTAAATYVRQFEWDRADVRCHHLAPYFNLTMVDCDQNEIADVIPA
jgi:hypothetical protein